jgi:CelD/BcsL family acetyltransferase involved in cellulose biosynthesis
MSSTALFRTKADIARRRIEQSGPIQVSTSLGRISLRIIHDPASVEADWERLQAIAPCTGPQTYDWANAWARHVLAPQGRDPIIVLGHAPELLFLWPFEMKTIAGLRVLKWLGSDHANYNMGLFAPEAASGFTGDDVAALLGEVGCQTDAAAAVLTAQPFAWDGVSNPFVRLPHQDAPSAGYAVRLGDFTALYQGRFSKRSRGTLERKERKLADSGEIVYGWAGTRDEKLALLDTFFAQKARQLAAMGVKNVFDAHARAFYREVALLEGDNPSRLRLGYLKIADNVLATFSGTLCHSRLGAALSSLAEDERQRQSSGALLLKHQIEEASANGIAFYDIGVGQARHKDEWCDVGPAAVRQLHRLQVARALGNTASCRHGAVETRDQIEPEYVAAGATLSPQHVRAKRLASLHAQIAATRPSSPVRPSLPVFS